MVDLENDPITPDLMRQEGFTAERPGNGVWLVPGAPVDQVCIQEHTHPRNPANWTLMLNPTAPDGARIPLTGMQHLKDELTTHGFLTTEGFTRPAPTP